MSSSSSLGSSVSRRAFLGGSAAGASLVLGRSASAIPKEDPDVIKVGLIGCGGRGTGAALQAMNAEEGTVVLTAMADVFEDRLTSSHDRLKEALGEEKAGRLQVDDDHRFLGFDAWKQLLATDVDVVLLTTPPHFRPMMLEAAVAAGKHVFAEKPMAVDAQGVRRVLAAIEVAREKQRAVVAGFCWRYHTRHRALYSRVHEGAIGDVQTVYATYNTGPNAHHDRQEAWSDMEYQIRNWYHFLWLSGDHVLEQACHSLDKIAWTMKDVAPLSCTGVGGRQVRQHGNNWDHFTAAIDYPGGVKGFLMCRQMDGCANDNSDWIWGTKGQARVGWSRHEISGENPWTYDSEEPEVGMYQEEHNELFASIRAGKPINDGLWMAHSTLLAIMVRTAAYTGQVITWDDIMKNEDRLGPETYALGPVALRAPAMPGLHEAPSGQ